MIVKVLVEDAVPAYNIPDTVSLVDEALVNVLCPVTESAPERVARPDTFNTLEYSTPEEVKLVVDALAIVAFVMVAL